MADTGAAQAGVEPGARTVIGIALGNSNSSIAVTIDDKAEVIANEDGDRQIPTVLSYADGDEYYGGQAKNFLVRNASNTLAYFKDFLGQEFKAIDPTHTHASAHPKDQDGVSFSIQDKGPEDEASIVSVSEVTTRYIKRLVTAGSEYLGKPVTSAVITVPTNFNEKQREALTKAANAAGIEVLQLVSEPVASVLAYDARPEATVEDKIIVVADLGGTRSDISIVASRSGMYTVLATVHDYEFAGVHLDQALIDHFAKEFMKQHNSTKKALSKSNNASFSVESLADGHDFSITINRLRYEMVARKVFEGFNRLIEGAIKKAGLDVLDIDEVVLAGGTGHTPRIAHNLVSLFPESTTILAPAINVASLNPSELAAEDIEQSTHPAVSTVKHLSNAIGVLTVGADGEEVFTPIVAPETAVPARRSITFPAPANGGDVLIKIVEGNTHIKVTQPEPKAKPQAKDGDSDDDSDDESDEEEEQRKSATVSIREAGAQGGVRGNIKASS
ncbi:unnamed protein product [Parascedosporium putredinis]|uniref:Uncharacterized protein n=1 Tax=Parascedosporium putredinis TaxID=1442378 RepID=A0A9P1GVP1_9PEZI|nr:unnamed protein product [Parascedosporium putredinis]CAI7987884.1 unnamed protein product [Parascedosporium putredinis]